MQILSEVKNIRIASSEVVNYIKKTKNNVSNNMLFDIKLCVEEAVRNAITHGNNSNADLPVIVNYSINGNSVKITVEDKGKGFDVRRLPDPTLAKNLYKESGRGVYLMHKLMDKITYNSKGNIVTMEKKLEG